MSALPARILVVDDDAYARDVVALVLREDGYQVTLAADGQAGLEAFRADHYDLVITDHLMPGMSGSEMAGQIANIAPRVPIVMLSAFGERTTKEMPPAAVGYYLKKPFTRAGLCRTVKEALHRRPDEPGPEQTR